MSTVDPYTVRIPAAFAKDPELAAWYQYTDRFLHDLWQGVTGSTGDTENGETTEGEFNKSKINNNSALIAQLLERIECLERTVEVSSALSSAISSSTSSGETALSVPIIKREFKSVTVSTDTTLNNFNFANVTSGATVTLPASPIENSVIIIRNGDGSTVNINANGKTLNGETIGKLYRKSTAITIQYFIDSDEWLAR